MNSSSTTALAYHKLSGTELRAVRRAYNTLKTSQKYSPL